MKTQLIFGCLFAALAAPALYANDVEPKDEFFNLILSDDDEETNKEGYVFAFADNKSVSFQMVGDEIATAEEDANEETSSDEDEAPRAEEA